MDNPKTRAQQKMTIRDTGTTGMDNPETLAPLGINTLIYM
jgi:hypothetical protein